jgi:short-subunit dehydrogenase
VNVDKTILITGASSGVGASLVGHLCKNFHVIAISRRIDRMRYLFGDNPRVECHQVDLSRKEEIEVFLGSLLARYDCIPYLVNNAGVMVRKSLPELSIEEFEYSLAVNAVAPLLVLNAFLPRMRAYGFGRVINLTSGAPFNCFPGFAAYSASKGALNSLTITAAKENIEFDIKINLMSPGPVRSEMAPDAPMLPESCLPTIDFLLSLPSDGPSGSFFWLGRELPVSPDFDGVQWLAGTASDKFPRIF